MLQQTAQCQLSTSSAGRCLTGSVIGGQSERSQTGEERRARSRVTIKIAHKQSRIGWAHYYQIGSARVHHIARLRRVQRVRLTLMLVLSWWIATLILSRLGEWDATDYLHVYVGAIVHTLRSANLRLQVDLCEIFVYSVARR